MAFCPSCGAPVEGRFCAKCGTAVEAGAAPAAGMPASNPTGAPAAAGLTENVASALCYVLGLITGILFLVLAPYNQNKNIRFHAFQSIFLHLASIIIWWGLIFILHGFAVFLTPLIGIGFFVLWLVMIFKAYQGQKVVLPVIGNLAQQQA